jgi:hypothetical protein
MEPGTLLSCPPTWTVFPELSSISVDLDVELDGGGAVELDGGGAVELDGGGAAKILFYRYLPKEECRGGNTDC